MKKTRPQPGLPVSAAAHVGLLLAALLAFPEARRFEDAQEAVPVDIITDSAVNEVMKGEKTAKEVKPIQRADKLRGDRRDQAAAAARRGEEGYFRPAAAAAPPPGGARG